MKNTFSSNEEISIISDDDKIEVFLDIFWNEYPQLYEEAHDSLKSFKNEVPASKKLIFKLKSEYPLEYLTVIEREIIQRAIIVKLTDISGVSYDEIQDYTSIDDEFALWLSKEPKYIKRGYRAYIYCNQTILGYVFYNKYADAKNLDGESKPGFWFQGPYTKCEHPVSIDLPIGHWLWQYVRTAIKHQLTTWEILR